MNHVEEPPELADPPWHESEGKCQKRSEIGARGVVEIEPDMHVSNIILRGTTTYHMKITKSFHKSLYGEMWAALMRNPVEFESVDSDRN